MAYDFLTDVRTDNKKSKSNHYVSQFYMKGFLDPSAQDFQEPYLWIYDNKKGLLKNRAPINVFCQKNLYSEYSPESETIHRFENYMNENVDDPFSRFKRKFEKAILNFDLDFLQQNFSNSDRLFLAFFIVWQIKRTKKSLNELETGLKSGFQNFLPEALDLIEQNTNFLQNLKINFTATTGFEYQGTEILSFLKDKNIIFTVIDMEGGYYISSDNPILRTNSRYSNESRLDDSCTEFTFPLSSKILVSLYGKGSKIILQKMKSRKEIRRINQSFAKNAYQYIFGPNKVLVESLKEYANIGIDRIKP